MEFKGIQNENLNIPPEFLAVKAREASDAPAQPEDRGLAPEVQRTVDNAVLEAFSSDFDSDAAFKARWKDTVEKAQRRKEQLAKQQQEESARARSIKNLQVQERRVAEMEEHLAETPPPAQKGYYSLTPEAPAAKAAAAAPLAEKLDAAVAERARVTASQGDESTYKKTGSQKASFIMHSRFSKEGFRRFAHRNLPCKGDSGKEIFRKIVMDVSFVALVCALVYLAIYFRNYRARIRDDSEINSEIESGAEISEYDLDNAWAEMHAMYPDVDFPEGMNIKFAKTYAMNKDTVGQLTIIENNNGVSAKRIQTVILQNRTEDYYLYRDFYKKYSRYGHPYVSGQCRMGPEGISKNTIIYGHNTHDHMIFNRLEDYMTVSGYVSAPIITLDTLYETTKWKIFAVMLTNADPEDNNGQVFEYLFGSFSSNDAFIAKMREIQARSMIHTGVDVQPGDKTLMLYTCYRSIFKSGRLVIVARQLREGESEEINTSLVYYDSSAIFPAAYYTGSPTTTEPTAPAETTRGSASSENVTASTAPPETTAAPEITEAPEPTATEAPATDASPPETDAVQGETGAGGGE